MVNECKGCVYWRYFAWGLKACHYALDNPGSVRAVMGHTQDLCTHKTTKEAARKLNRIDDIKARDLYDKGLTDKQIGDAFRVSTSAVGGWRRKNNLPVNPARKAKKKAEAPSENLPIEPPEVQPPTAIMTVSALCEVIGSLGDAVLLVQGKAVTGCQVKTIYDAAGELVTMEINLEVM